MCEPDARSVEYARGHVDGYYGYPGSALLQDNADYRAGRSLGAKERKQDGK